MALQVRPVRSIDLPRLDRLFEACAVADGHQPIGEHKYLSLVRGELGPSMGLVLERDGELVAYAHLTPNREDRGWSLEMAIHPLARSQEVVETMLRAAIDAVRARGGKTIRYWVYQPAIAGVLNRLGFHQDRELRQLRRPLPPEERPSFPPGVVVRGFRVGVDEAAWLEVNNRAFAGHPENGAWDLEVLRSREQLDWFDPEGIRMAWEGDTLIGFCWTKRHPGEIGEIYVIAVDPDHQGRGLGRALTLEGLWYLYERRGATVGMLYVDASNERALRLYGSLGFYLDHIDRSFTIEV